MRAANLSLKWVVVRSIWFLTARRVVTQIIITLSNLVLVRILFPADFGVFTIMQFIASLVWVFADLGLGKALIQRNKTPRTIHLRSVWWTQLIMGILFWAIISLFSGDLLNYWQDSLNGNSVMLLRVLLFSQIFINMSSVSMSLLERNLNYKRIVVTEMISLFITQYVAILLGLRGFGVASLVYGQFVGRLVLFILYVFLAPWNFGFTFSLRRLKELLPFGISYQQTVFLGLLNSAVVPLFVGRFPGPGKITGAEAVGLITWAMGVAVMTASFSVIVEQFIFPLVSRLQNNVSLASRAVTKMMRVMAIVTFLAGVVIFIEAHDITRIIYTERWIAGVIVLRLATIQFMISSVVNLGYAQLLAFGEARFVRNFQLILTLIQWLLTVPLVLILGFWGANVALVITAVCALWVFKRVGRYLNVTLSIFIVPLGAALSAGVFLQMIKGIIKVEDIFGLLAVSVLAVLFYGLVLFGLMRRTLVEDITMVREVFKYRIKRKG